MQSPILLLIGLLAVINATELNAKNYDDETADSETIGIYDVDCTEGGKELCSQIGVQGYPTLKYGDPSALDKYEGGRDYKALEKFASGLKPTCSPSNIDLCDDDEKATIEAVQAMSPKELATAIEEGEKEIADAEALFKAEVDKLQETYKRLSEEKDASVAAIKDSGLGMKKAVQAANKAAKKAARKAAKAAKKAKAEL